MLMSATIAAVTLSWSRTIRPIRHSRPISSHADVSVTRPLASGRRRVRSTWRRDRGRRCRCRRSRRCASRRRRGRATGTGPSGRRRPRARRSMRRAIEQPAADRPVEPHERGIGAQARRKRADEPAPLAVGDDVDGGGQRAHLSREAAMPATPAWPPEELAALFVRQPWAKAWRSSWTPVRQTISAT